MPDVTYRELQAVLDGLGSAIGASEAHGCLCGGLCARASYGAPEWVGGLLEGAATAAVDRSSRRLLLGLHREAERALHARDSGFAPLVPDDQAPLADRVRALADWCGGFLYGVGTAGAGDAATVADGIGEILRDLAEIARARQDPREAGEAGEEAFMELFEFVRTAVQLAFEELASARATRPHPAAALH